MRIVGSELSLGASRTQVLREQTHERLRIGVAATTASGASAPVRESQLSPESRAMAARALAQAADLPQGNVPPASTGTVAGSEATDPMAEAIEHDPNLRFLIDLIEALTGRKVRLFDARELQPGTEANMATNGNTPPGGRARAIALDYERHSIAEEFESTRFEAEGLVRTADGQEIRFRVELAMTRYHREESSVRVQVGSAQRKDPLVLNFAGGAAQLLDQRFDFDIDADGRPEALPLLTGGSGFLAFDRNGNGRIDDGRELFGALSGDGFADLAALDSDGNGWIDAGDDAFSTLRIWRPSADGPGELGTLSAQGVSAIGLRNIATGFELRGIGNSDLGRIRASGVYLTAAGGVGVAQQVDLSV